jgi:hypothetical protein
VPFDVMVSIGEPLYGKESYDAFVSELEAAMRHSLRRRSYRCGSSRLSWRGD